MKRTVFKTGRFRKENKITLIFIVLGLAFLAQNVANLARVLLILKLNKYIIIFLFYSLNCIIITLPVLNLEDEKGIVCRTWFQSSKVTVR